MLIALVGNPVDGVRAIGPFRDQDAAAEWADNDGRNLEWWLVALDAPDSARP